MNFTMMHGSTNIKFINVPSDAALEEASATVTARNPVVLPRRLIPTHTAQRFTLTGSLHPVTSA